jgi:predicted secreted Zn-dependent protease
MSGDGTWRKSSYSGGQGGDCVEVAARPAVQMAVRDSKDQNGPALRFSREAWNVFTAGIKGRHRSA